MIGSGGGTLPVFIEKVQQIRDRFLKIFAIYDEIEESVLEQELGSLESIRQIFFNGFFDHPGSGKPDQRLGFCEVDIAQHRERGGNASGRRIGKEGEIRDPGSRMLSQFCGSLGHLTQAIQAAMAMARRCPTTEPMEPPMNLKSMAAMISGLRLTFPRATLMASVRFVFL